MAKGIGTGASITFGTSAFTADIMDITPPGASRESIETSHMGTPGSDGTGWKTFIPATLSDQGELSFDIQFDPATEPPMNGAIETITITFSDGTTWTFSGFMTGYESSVPLEELMQGTVTVKATGKATIA